MRPLAPGNLDGMAHLDHVNLVGIERLCGERVEARRRRRRCAVRHPADNSAGEKSQDHCRGRSTTPRACAAGEIIEIEARRNRFGGEHAEARPDRVGLRAPLGDASRVFRMGRKPRLDGDTAVGCKLAVDIGVQLLLRHGWVLINHRFLPRVI